MRGNGLVWALASGALLLSACSSGPEPIAFQNRTFYYGPDEVSDSQVSAFEQHYPPLDYAPQAPSTPYLGVSVLGGAVHLSRPTNWIIRNASNEPERRYIEYLSPHKYLFTVYERLESPLDPWRVIMGRYEEDVQKSGSELLGQRVPVATWNAQGRAYLVKRKVKAAKSPFVNMSREMLLRSDNRIVLVQIVHEGDSLAPITDELLRVVETLDLQ